MRDADFAAEVERELAKVPENPHTARTKQEPAPREDAAYSVLCYHYDRYGSDLEPHVRLGRQRRKVRRALPQICHGCHRTYSRSRANVLCDTCNDAKGGDDG